MVFNIFVNGPLKCDRSKRLITVEPSTFLVNYPVAFARMYTVKKLYSLAQGSQTQSDSRAA